MATNKKFEWFATGNAPVLFPTELAIGYFLLEDFTTVSIPVSYPFATQWGEPVSMHETPEKEHLVPKLILMVWFSVVDSKFYAVAEELPKEQIEALLSEKDEKTKEPKYNTIIAGMAPYGKLAIWLSGKGITTEVAWLQGKEISYEMRDFAPDFNLTPEEYSKKVLAECAEAAENLRKNGLPDPSLFEQYMQKFNYRIIPKFGEDTNFYGIELYYLNGEINATNRGEHTAFAMRAKPRKIVLKWIVGKFRHEVCFWIDEQKNIEIFRNCYGSDTRKEGTLIIQVDESYKQIRLFLQTVGSLIEFPEDSVQYIIFRESFEFHRSSNYKIEEGGWRK